MTFAELKAELIARGAGDLTDPRAGVYINAANAELDRMFLWPWREKSVTGTGPVSIADLGPIEAVTNETQHYRLRAAQYADLIDAYGDLSASGIPSCYYRAVVSGVPVVATYPMSSDTIGVQYWKQTATMSAAGNEPDSPDEAHYLIVDLAQRRVYRDIDAHEHAEAVQAEIDRQLEGLLVSHPPGVMDSAGVFVAGYGVDG